MLSIFRLLFSRPLVSNLGPADIRNLLEAPITRLNTLDRQRRYRTYPGIINIHISQKLDNVVLTILEHNTRIPPLALQSMLRSPTRLILSRTKHSSNKH